jgi:hypothetical protein
MGKAFWIKDKKVIDITTTTHINFIINHPDDFFLTKDYIKKLYNKYKEKLGVEGKAREEIIRKVSELGWVRVRHYKVKQEEYWSIQYDVYNERNKRTIKNFVEWALYESKIMNKNDTLLLLGYKDNSSYSYNFISGGVLNFLSEHKEIETDSIIKIEYFE